MSQSTNACPVGSSRFSHVPQFLNMSDRTCACCNKSMTSDAQKYLYGETKDGFPTLGGYIVKTRRINIQLTHGCRRCYMHDRIEVCARACQSWVVAKIFVSSLNFHFIVFFSYLCILSVHSRNFFVILASCWFYRWMSPSNRDRSLPLSKKTKIWTS